jgi:membrane protease YdiL (CAAX protease family)
VTEVSTRSTPDDLWACVVDVLLMTLGFALVYAAPVALVSSGTYEAWMRATAFAAIAGVLTCGLAILLWRRRFSGTHGSALQTLGFRRATASQLGVLALALLIVAWGWLRVDWGGWAPEPSAADWLKLVKIILAQGVGEGVYVSFVYLRCARLTSPLGAGILACTCFGLLHVLNRFSPAGGSSNFFASFSMTMALVLLFEAGLRSIWAPAVWHVAIDLALLLPRDSYSDPDVRRPIALANFASLVAVVVASTIVVLARRRRERSSSPAVPSVRQS